MTTPERRQFSNVVAIRPSDVPAADLPETEPSDADLLAIEHGDDVLVQHRINQALKSSAYEHAHRELMGLRRRHRDSEATDNSTAPTTFWRAA